MTAVLSAFGLRRGPSLGDRVLAFLIHWAILAVGVWAAANLVHGIHYEGWRSIIIVSMMLGFLNALVRPILFWLSLPVTVVTLGLFLIILNAAMLWLADRLGQNFSQVRFSIDHFFWDAVLGALVISLVGWLLGFAIKAGGRVID